MLGSPEFQRRLEKWLADQLHERSVGLTMAKDWADFTERRGFIKGLTRVSEEIRVITKQLSGD